MSGSTDPSLAGRVAIVNGAAGGMGRAITTALAAAGAAVVAADVADGEEQARALRSTGADVRFVRADVSDAGDVAAMVAAAVETHGRLGCAVNAASIEFESLPIADTDDGDFDRMIAVNLRSVFLCLKHEIRAMLALRTTGSIVNIASTNSFRPQRNQPAYTASKHGVLGLTRSAAMDYGHRGIRVNAIAPGAIDTPMLNNALERHSLDPTRVARHMSVLDRFGTPEEIADAAVWLCSDASSYVTGHTLAVDGGYLGQ